MKRLLLPGIIFCISSFSAFAQWNDDLVDNHHQGKVAIGMYGDADFASNSITSDFAYKFIQGGYIDSNAKQQVVSNLQHRNRLSYSINYGLYAVLYNDTIKRKHVFNFFFALKHKKYLNTEFTDDDFKLPFYGNASYAGKTAQLSPFSLNNLSYQQAELGVVSTNFGGGAQFGLGISFLAGQQCTSINASSATFYTDTYGQYLTFNTNAQAFQSDTSAGYIKRINGYGASLDLYFRAPYNIGKRKGNISISVSDMGFLYWNNKSINYQKDTSYTYSGITIASISDLQNASFNNLNKDSLKNKYFPFGKQAFYSTIPATLKICTNTALTEKFHLQAGYWNIFNANDVGYVYLQADKYFSHGWMTSLQIGYGDYSTINGALQVVKKFKRCKIDLVINRLQGMILPGKFGGAGAFLGYSYTFGK